MTSIPSLKLTLIEGLALAAPPNQGKDNLQPRMFTAAHTQDGDGRRHTTPVPPVLLSDQHPLVPTSPKATTLKLVCLVLCFHSVM